MFKVKAPIVMLLGAFALSAVATSPAFAGWFIEGEELSGTAALATTAKVDEDFLLKSAAADVELECDGNTLNGVSPEFVAPQRDQGD